MSSLFACGAYLLYTAVLALIVALAVRYFDVRKLKDHPLGMSRGHEESTFAVRGLLQAGEIIVLDIVIADLSVRSGIKYYHFFPHHHDI